MKKIAIICVVLVIFCSCNKWGKSDVAFDKNAPSLAFQKLTITWGGAISSESTEKIVSVDYGKNLDVAIKYFVEAELKGECTDSAKLTDVDYIQVLTLLDKAHLDIYFPGSDCEPLLGTMGVTIAYLLTDGTQKEYATACNMDAQINELLDYVDGLATADVADCTEEGFTEGPQIPLEPPENGPEEGFCGPSSYDSCENDADCMIGWCHALCHNVQNPQEGACPLILRECEDYEKYGASCGCVDEKCQWK